ncbi:hypothetical protein HQ397_05975 [Aeromonas hydrophila]|uniref:Rha family transcriptional regulator n=1 Tax=Aeromonas hydrophila TaxID=644 RepID=UPI001C76C6EA|nr:Rha family transcriptional regulator [Aeromonas hydrophila]QWL69731.1 hypothetical protein HQ397_05975 [Aeromonas hydrophila]
MNKQSVNINLSDILSTIRFNQGHMPTHELAMMLGKRHSDLIRKLESQGVLIRKLRSIVCETQVGRKGGGIQTYDSYLLNDEQAVALAMSYDMQLGMMVYRGFKAALEVVDAVNAGEAQEAIAKKAEDATFEVLFKSTVTHVCGKVCVNTLTKPKRERITRLMKMVTVQMGGIQAALSNIVEFHKLFAVQAKIDGLPLYRNYDDKALEVIDKSVLEDRREAARKRDAFDVFSSW